MSKRYLSVSAERVESELAGEENVRVKCADRFQAQDVRRVMRALDNPFKVGVSGSAVIVPAEHLKIVRDYLAGRLDPRRYRRNMPGDVCGDNRSIYERNLVYV